VETVVVVPTVALPDLVILEGSVRISPSAPSQGETIFVDAEIANLGEAVAREFQVELRDTHGRRLPNRAGEPTVTLASMAPGEEQSVRLRWDPTDKAGEQEVVVVADSRRAVAESDEGNNESGGIIRVLTPEDVRFTRAVRHEDARLDPPSVLLTTQLSNFGETDALDQVVTWYREGDRETVIGETSIEVIRGGATIPVQFRWEFSEEEITRMRSGEEFHPTCDAGTRAGMRRFAAPLEGEAPAP
jgi:subtilase family serine protease